MATRVVSKWVLPQTILHRLRAMYQIATARYYYLYTDKREVMDAHNLDDILTIKNALTNGVITASDAARMYEAELKALKEGKQ